MFLSPRTNKCKLNFYRQPNSSITGQSCSFALLDMWFPLEMAGKMISNPAEKCRKEDLEHDASDCEVALEFLVLKPLPNIWKYAVRTCLPRHRFVNAEKYFPTLDSSTGVDESKKCIIFSEKLSRAMQFLYDGKRIYCSNSQMPVFIGLRKCSSLVLQNAAFDDLLITFNISSCFPRLEKTSMSHP